MVELNDLFKELDKASDVPPPSSDLSEIVDKIETTKTLPESIKTEEKPIEIGKYLRRLDDVTEDVLGACKADRREAQELINILKEQVEASIAGGVKLSTGIVESLVKAIEVKSNINTTAVKMIEANAKTIAATKSSINIQQNTIASAAGFDSSTLEKILSEPMGDNEDI
jgi:hypothetical protein